MKYMRKNSFVVCLVISAILLTSSFAMPVLAAENTGIETSSVTRSVPGYYKCTGSDVNIRSGCTAYCISRITPKTAFNQIRHVSCESCRYLLNLLIKSLRIYTRFCKIFKCSHYCFFIFLIGYTKPCVLCLQDINFSTFIFDQMVN